MLWPHHLKNAGKTVQLLRVISEAMLVSIIALYLTDNNHSINLVIVITYIPTQSVTRGVILGK